MTTTAEEVNDHDALLFSSDEELVGAAVPFLRSGLDAGERAYVIGADRTAALLREALDDPRVGSLPRGEVYQRAALAVGAYRQLLNGDVAGGHKPVRLVGEIDFGAGPDDWMEWGRFEAIVSHVFQPLPVWIVCVYDMRELPDEVAEAVQLTHPNLVTESAREPNPRFQDPAEFLRSHAPTHRDPLEETEPALTIEAVTDLRAMRRKMTETLEGLLPTEKIQDFVFAASEIATNARRHGRPPVLLRLWTASERLLCLVTDRGAGFDDSFVGYLLPDLDTSSHGGMGYWFARQLVDRVYARKADDGFTVQLLMVP